LGPRKNQEDTASEMILVKEIKVKEKKLRQLNSKKHQIQETSNQEFF